MWKHTRRGHRIFALLLAAVGTGSLVACHRSPEERVEHVGNKIASKLDFSEQQRGLLKEIVEEIKIDLREMRAKREGKFNEFESLLMANTLDKEKVKAHIQEQQAYRDSKVDKYLDKVAALHATLTPEQKREMLDKIQKFKKHWME